MTKLVLAQSTTKVDGPAPLSFRGRRWIERSADRRRVNDLVRAGHMPAVARILAARGFDVSSAEAFLEASIPDLLPRPGFFLDLDKAVARLEAAISRGDKIAIWGDYDCDGATSTAILTRTLRLAGVEPVIHIPDRITEGYGPNAAGLQRLAAEGVNLVCVLDSGTTAVGPLTAARDAGLDVIVVDHHAAEETLPPAVAIVNPNRLDQAPGYGYVCAAGMTWLLCRELAFRLPGQPIDKVIDLLDIVALGTVCDVVPLVGLNRAFVREGLEIMSRRGNPGIAALAEIAGIEEDRFSVYHCGFLLGPRVNAGGRIGEAMTGSLLLTSDDPLECKLLANRLNEWNRERQEIEQACVAQAKEMAEEQADSPIIFVIAEGWHEGVIGIVAGRLKEAYDKPTFVFSVVKPGEAKGSGRSMAGFDMGAAVIAARQKGLLIKGGGHAMAAGASLTLDQADAFRSFLEEAARDSAFGIDGAITKIDTEITPGQAHINFVETIDRLQPFGQANPKPRLLLRNCKVAGHRIMKDKHLKLEIERKGGRPLPALLFNAKGSPLGDQLLDCMDFTLDLVVTLGINEWNGNRSVQALIEDARLSNPDETIFW
jgi:single-stranded-DNA-specific exonuclease